MYVEIALQASPNTRIDSVWVAVDGQLSIAASTQTQRYHWTGELPNGRYAPERTALPSTLVFEGCVWALYYFVPSTGVFRYQPKK